LWPSACGEWNEIAGDIVSDLRYLYRSSRDHGADRARPRVPLCAGEQPMTDKTKAAERITAALLLVLCIVFAVFV
jgi:hypothetical protein